MHRRAHVESTRLVLDEAVSRGIERFLLVSSAHATGRGTSSARCESLPGRPETPYARAKLEAEELALSYADRHPLEVVAVRPPGIYGPGDKSVVSSLSRAARLNLWRPLEGIQALHSMVSVDNLARAPARRFYVWRATEGSLLGRTSSRTLSTTVRQICTPPCAAPWGKGPCCFAPRRNS